MSKKILEKKIELVVTVLLLLTNGTELDHNQSIHIEHST